MWWVHKDGSACAFIFLLLSFQSGFKNVLLAVILEICSIPLLKHKNVNQNRANRAERIPPKQFPAEINIASRACVSETPVFPSRSAIPSRDFRDRSRSPFPELPKQFPRFFAPFDGRIADASESIASLCCTNGFFEFWAEFRLVLLVRVLY